MRGDTTKPDNCVANSSLVKKILEKQDVKKQMNLMTPF